MREYDAMGAINAMEQDVKDVKSVMSSMVGEMMKDVDDMKMLSITNHMMDNWFNMQKGICEKLEAIELTQGEIKRTLYEIRGQQKREKEFRVFTEREKNRNNK